VRVLWLGWRWERWGEPTQTADRGWNGPLYGLVSRIPPVYPKNQGPKSDRLLDEFAGVGLAAESEQPKACVRWCWPITAKQMHPR